MSFKQITVFTALAFLVVSCGRGAPENAHPPDVIMNSVSPASSVNLTGPDGRRLNVIIILADDLGYTDIGAFGGEIPTPNLDRLAFGGIRLTNLYASHSCSPSRAMLMSGVNPHAAGVGAVPGIVSPKGNPSYLGYLSPNVASLAELMQRAGYATMMTGKWDLGAANANSPVARGFDRSFALLHSAAGHFSDMTGLNKRNPRAEYREDYRNIAALPDDFYSTTFYTDKMIDYIKRRENRSAPFFAYLAYTAPHWPLQAPEEWIEKFKGAYDDGFAPVLKKRLERGAALGVFKSPDASDKVRRMETFWSSLDEKGRRSAARRMEVYAAMVAIMDKEIGRLIDYLETSGEADNTVILFMSDNGPDFSNTETLRPFRGWVEEHFDNSIDNMGRRDSYISYGREWAEVGAGPFRLYKGTAGEGGVRTPGILYWPGDPKPGRIVDAFLSFADILPTAIDIAGLAHPGRHEDATVLPPEGGSFAALLAGRPRAGAIRAEAENPPMVWESAGTVAVRKGEWKLFYAPSPLGEGEWRLYNLREDPYETNDLSSEHDEITKELRRHWEAYKDHYQVENIPWLFRRMLFNSRPEEFREAAKKADKS